MRVHLAGVRGSTPAPGADFVRYGGHTSCLAVETGGIGLVLDAGTGLRNVSSWLAGRAFHGTILLTHLHWDHVQGLPFFAAGDRDDACVHLALPAQGGDAAAVLARSMSPPHFPIGPDGLRGEWSFGFVDEGEHRLDGVEVTAREVPHKAGRTFGYRVASPDGSFAYLPDHAVGSSPSASALALADGVDVLFHGGQFTDAEEAVADRFGHATIGRAIALAEAASVRELVLVHHGPTRTDDDLDELAARFSGVHFAAEGEVTTISGGATAVTGQLDREVLA